MVDFKKLLSKPVDSIHRPPVPPEGIYFGTLTGFKYQESAWANKETGEKEAQVSFFVRLNGVGEGVDEAEARAAGAFGRIVSKEYSIEDGQEWPLKMFLESLGIATAGKTLDTTIPECVNASVVVELTKRPNPKEEGQFFTNVKSIKGVG